MFGLWGKKAKEEPKSRDYKESYDRYKRVKEMERKEKDISERWKKMISNIGTTSVGDAWVDANSTTSIYTNNTWTSIDTSTTVSNPYITTSPSTGVQIVGDLTVNGRDIMKELDVIKTLLDGAVLQRDPAMEEEFSKLKELADEYQKQLEKYKTFKALKESA